jgi:hypothetical protein
LVSDHDFQGHGRIGRYDPVAVSFVAVTEHRYAVKLTIGVFGIVDATISRAPGLAQKVIKARDRIMHQTHSH